LGISVGTGVRLAFTALIAMALISAAQAKSAAEQVATPAETYGALYRAVQTAHVFPDNKTFVDLIPRDRPEAIMAAFRTEKPVGKDALGAFVDRHFRSQDQLQEKLPLREHIKALWTVLAKPPIAAPIGSSAIQLPAAFVVAGGRFHEMYYWDSFFTMLGLKADGEDALIESMLANFVSLIDRYGHIPNGTRTYYLSRSQPPFLAMMMDLSQNRDPQVRAKRLKALQIEHAYWMAGASCLAGESACKHVVRMPDGTLLNRYWDARDTPRDESYTLDVDTAQKDRSRRPAEIYRDLRAGAESGWDFGSRWFRDGKTLATIHTTDIVPVDLNSLLWNLEKSIARRCAAAGESACAAKFEQQANARRSAMMRYLWSTSEERFADWDRSIGKPTASISAATLFPLFVGLATPDQAEKTARLTQARLLAPGGLRTTTVQTGEQWDAPNGWAPLLWIGVRGLERHGKSQIADELATRWLRTVSRFYACTGRMVEKYDIESGQAGGGGEYGVQDGFGWTNGVTRALLDRAGMTSAIVRTCPPQSR
jgi:alpha,alpha-trehalase